MEKDIKILEENLKNGSIYVNCGNTINKAIENVLWALKGKDCVIETQSHNEEVLEEYIAKLEKELETYKKIAEFLAKKIVGVIQYDYIYENICINNPNYVFCENIGNHIKCKQCLLENARKEVENEQKNT